MNLLGFRVPTQQKRAINRQGAACKSFLLVAEGGVLQQRSASWVKTFTQGLAEYQAIGILDR